MILLQPPANPTSNSCGVHREPLHCSPARHQPCACCSRPPTSSHGGRGGCSTPVTSGGGVQRAQRLGSGAHMAAPSHILPSPLVIPTCRSALPSYPLKDKHRQGLSGAAPHRRPPSERDPPGPYPRKEPAAGRRRSARRWRCPCRKGQGRRTGAAARPAPSRGRPQAGQSGGGRRQKMAAPQCRSRSTGPGSGAASMAPPPPPPSR